jgi:RNA 3'-terminal phosphate cyclase (ATP)
VTGQGFKVERIRARRARPGLRPQHLAAVRAAGMACGAEIHGAFDGSPDLRFLPGRPAAGEFHFDIGSAGAALLVLETIIPILATAGAASRVEVIGGTHVPRSPSFHFVARHWSEVVGRLGLRAPLALGCAGFYPRGGGVVRAEVHPWTRPASLDLSRRGALLAIRGVAGQARLRGDVARRAAEAARALVWEQRRIETEWEIAELTATSPGAFVQVEAVFENGRATFAPAGRAQAAGRSARGARGASSCDSWATRAAVDRGSPTSWPCPWRSPGRGPPHHLRSPPHLETVASVLRVRLRRADVRRRVRTGRSRVRSRP